MRRAGARRAAAGGGRTARGAATPLPPGAHASRAAQTDSHRTLAATSVYAGRVPAPPAPDSPSSAGALARRTAIAAGSLRAWVAPRCALCGTARGDPLCAGCAADFLSANERRCRVCALRLGSDGDLCGRCLRQPPVFDATHALADYAAPIDALISGLKFGHRLEIARTLGLLLGRVIDERTPSAACLVPIPLAFERQRERGFNQALEVARVAARTCRRRLLAHALLRVRHRPPQEALALTARRTNLRGAFAVDAASEATLAGRCVVLIDDVMTSGSTLDEAARVLKRAGAAPVICAVVARTP